jgi:hypothetical protein
MTEPTPLFHATAGEHAAYVEALLATPVPSLADITAAAEGARDAV